MAERGVDLSRHIATALTPEDVQSAALLLVMEERHRQMILRHSPEARGKVMLWRELAGEKQDVPDPYVYGMPEYAETLALLERALDAGWPALRAQLGLSPSSQAEPPAEPGR
jgi:protein-tyrosine-phosphatase